MLQEAFAAFGQVSSVAVIKDQFRDEPRGFGFVEMPSDKEATAVMTGVREIGVRQVTANEAKTRESGPRHGGAGREGNYSRSRRSW